MDNSIGFICNCFPAIIRIPDKFNGFRIDVGLFRKTGNFCRFLSPEATVFIWAKYERSDFTCIFLGFRVPFSPSLLLWELDGGGGAIWPTDPPTRRMWLRPPAGGGSSCWGLYRWWHRLPPLVSLSVVSLSVAAGTDGGARRALCCPGLSRSRSVRAARWPPGGRPPRQATAGDKRHLTSPTQSDRQTDRQTDTHSPIGIGRAGAIVTVRLCLKHREKPEDAGGGGGRGRGRGTQERRCPGSKTSAEGGG